jgi:predicted transcriptional regulator
MADCASVQQRRDAHFCADADFFDFSSDCSDLMSTRVVSAHVPSDLAKRLDELAARLDRPRAWVVKEAIAAYVTLEQRRHEQTLEALAEVDREKTVDQADIEVWAMRLGKPSQRKRSIARVTEDR